MWLEYNIVYEIENMKKHCVSTGCTCTFLSSFAMSDAEAQLYSMCTDKKSIC